MVIVGEMATLEKMDLEKDFVNDSGVDDGVNGVDGVDGVDVDCLQQLP